MAQAIGTKEKKPMRSKLSILIILGFISTLKSQHTFSIVAIDTITLEIGSAGATCLDSRQEGVGAVVISDIIPGRGAIHSQALLNFSNQANARKRMEAGDKPQQIIDWLRQNDVQRLPELRQYGIVAIDPAGNIETAAFTGRNCLDVKGQILGSDYAIQGNILIGTEVLDSMEQAFLRTEGLLEEKLMMALQAAAIQGADVRCLSEGVSSRSAFIRVAKPGDEENQFYLDLAVNVTPFGIEPIEELNISYLKFKSKDRGGLQIKAYPNPFFDTITIETPYPGPWKANLYDIGGKEINQYKWQGDKILIENINLKASTTLILQVVDEKRPKAIYSIKLFGRGQ